MGREDSFLICDEEVHVVVYDPERAEPVCSKCGLVLDDARLDFALEFDAVPKARPTKRRRPCPTISETSKRSLEHSSLERNLQDMFLKKSVQKSVREKVLELCRVVREQRLYRGYPLSTLSSAVIYTAHRLCRVPVTLAEYAVKSATERKRVARCYEKLCQELELNVPRFESVDYLSRLAKKKGIDDETLTLASKILRRAKEKHLVRGSNPVGIAAAVLYFACNVTGTRITQKELASAATVSEATVRISFKKLRAFFKLQHVCEQSLNSDSLKCRTSFWGMKMLKQFVRGRSVYAHAINNLLENEKFSFGEPWTLTTESLSAVIPILQNSVRNRGYLVAQKISGDKISVTDTGQIGKLKVKLSNVDKPVFVRAGTVFKGQSTQSRIVGTGIVLDSEKENSLDVFCVHASHGISRDSGFSIDKAIGPRNIEDVLTSPTKSQSRVWAAASVRKRRASIRACPMCGSGRFVQSYDAELVCMDCGQSVPGVSTMGNFMDNDGSRAVSLGDDLVANLREMNEFNQRLDDMLSKVPADLQNQVGIVMIDSKGVYGLEMFDHPDSWRGFSKSIICNYADVLAKERSGEGLFALKVERIPEAIKKFLQKAKDLSETSVFKNNISETKALSGKLIGEYSTLEHDLIHLILKRNVVV